MIKSVVNCCGFAAIFNKRSILLTSKVASKLNGHRPSKFNVYKIYALLKGLLEYMSSCASTNGLIVLCVSTRVTGNSMKMSYHYDAYSSVLRDTIIFYLISLSLLLNLS